MSAIAFIPAKMKSERLPGKNLAMLCGHPLLYYSVKVAQLTTGIDKVYVSSESDQVLNLAHELGFIAVVRPMELSEPHIKNIDVLRHFYMSLDTKAETLVLLQPTHPCRHPDEIAAALHCFDKKKADSLVTVVPIKTMTGFVNDGIFEPLFSYIDTEKRESIYRQAGSFHIFRPERTFLTKDRFGGKIACHELMHPELEVDINHIWDLSLAEKILGDNKEYFSFFFNR